MSRWVIASRRQRTLEARRTAARRTEEAFKKLFDGGIRVRGIHRGGDARDSFAAVFDADPSETRIKKRLLPREDAILEPEIPHTASSLAPRASRVLRVLGDGQPLDNARVTIPSASVPGSSSALIEPVSGYWSMRVPDVDAIDEDVHLDPLAPGPYGWWHRAMGCAAGRTPSSAAGDGLAFESASASPDAEFAFRSAAAAIAASSSSSPAGAALATGASIAVGVIDTGCGPHAALWHVVDHGAYVNGVYSVDGRDGAQHGTHLCGLIGARACPDKPTGYLGVAPDVAIHSIRVCAIGQTTANQVDIALALRRLITVPVHVVTIGLSAAESSTIVADAIREAMEAGILCICPAGNTASRVRFPAALDDTAAVTALGLAGWGPPRARVHDFEPPPSERLRFGALDDDDRVYIASFSCVAPTAVTCAGPGAGIISCVPGEDGTAYAEMSGTSMAAALVTGALASILSAKENYLTLPRTLERADFAHALLGLHCRSLGIDRRYQGRGLPCVTAF